MAQAVGETCADSSHCALGFCVDGVCCDSVCNGLCTACSSATKGGGADGVCGLAADGVDAHGDCSDDGAGTCDLDGLCDGNGSCRVYPAGSSCGPSLCVENAQIGAACDGAGECLPTATVDCGAFACEQGVCAASCSSAGGCVDGAWCDGGACEPRGSLGASCGDGLACLSGHCVDGFCCQSACDGQCEACDVQGGEGSCVPVAGQPHGAVRPACDAGTDAEPCIASSCDGIERASCEGLVGSSVVCRAAACEDGLMTLASICDGSGSCPDARTKDCGSYACGETECIETCAGDEDCAAGSTCDASTGLCAAGATCVDDHTVEAPDGRTEDCSPYLCADGACRIRCESILDCTGARVCDDRGQCIAPAAPTEDAGDSGGCAVTSSNPRTPRAPWTLLLLVGLACTRWRRRATGRVCAADDRSSA